MHKVRTIFVQQSRLSENSRGTLKTRESIKLFLKLIFSRQKIHAEFELQGIEADKLNSQHWLSIEQRMTTEEAACQLTGADNDENG